MKIVDQKSSIENRLDQQHTRPFTARIVTQTSSVEVANTPPSISQAIDVRRNRLIEGEGKRVWESRSRHRGDFVDKLEHANKVEVVLCSEWPVRPSIHRKRQREFKADNREMHMRRFKRQRLLVGLLLDMWMVVRVPVVVTIDVFVMPIDIVRMGQIATSMYVADRRRLKRSRKQRATQDVCDGL